MMTPMLDGSATKFEAVGYTSSTTSGTTITANATPGSDGAYTQLIAATANDWYGFFIFIHSGGSTTSRGLVDVAIGAAASEVVLVPDLPYAHLNSAIRGAASRIWLPLTIAKGTRISARIHRSELASSTTKIMLYGCSGSSRAIPPFRRCTSYGAVLANARGTTVDPGGTANTLGANTQIDASTAKPIKALYLLTMKQDGAAVAATNQTNALEVYVGAAASEQVLLPELITYDLHSSTDISVPFNWGIGPLACDVPAASRLSCKARSSSNVVAEREAQVIILGLD